MTDSAFVAVMAELRRAVQPGGAETTRDSSGRAAVRDSIIKKYRVTSVALESTGSHMADDPVRAGEILRAIDRKVQTLSPTAPPPRPVQLNPPPATPASSGTPRQGGPDSSHGLLRPPTAKAPATR